MVERHNGSTDADIAPNTATYNAPINACAMAGEVEAALELLEEMGERRVPVNVASYNAALNACSKVNPS